MHDNRALEPGAARSTAEADEHLVELASDLEAAADAYARTVDQIDADASGGPWLEKTRGRMRSQLSECRVRADGLIDTPAETRAGSAAKRKALLRYWEVDIDCDPRASKLLSSVCADIDRLDVRLGPDSSPAGGRRPPGRTRRYKGGGRGHRP